MPLPAHPTLNSVSSQQNLATINGFASSNNTSNFFLGGTQRAWMTGHLETNAASREGPRPTPPQPRGRVPATIPKPKDISHGASKPSSTPLPVSRTCPSDVPRVDARANHASDTDRRLQAAEERSSNRSEASKPSFVFTAPISVPSDKADSSNLVATQGKATYLPIQSDLRHGLGISQVSLPLFANPGLAYTGDQPTISTNGIAMPLPLETRPLTTMNDLKLHGLNASVTNDAEVRKRTCNSASNDNLQKRTRLDDTLTTPPQTSGLNGQRMLVFGKDCLQYLDTLVQNVLTRRPLNSAENRRVLALRDACKTNDRLFCHVHQLECLRIMHSQRLTQMRWSQQEGLGFKLLGRILSPDSSKMQSDLVSYLADFPNPSHRLPEAYLSPVNKNLKAFLTRLATAWEPLRQVCNKRAYPPCCRELHTFLSLMSPHLQVMVFISLLRELVGHENQFHDKAVDMFLFDQRQYMARLKHPALLNQLACDEESQAFGRAYQYCCSKSHFSLSEIPLAHGESQWHAPPGTTSAGMELRRNTLLENSVASSRNSPSGFHGNNSVFSPPIHALSPMSVLSNDALHSPIWMQTYSPIQQSNTAPSAGAELGNLQKLNAQLSSTHDLRNRQLSAMQTCYQQLNTPNLSRPISLQHQTPDVPIRITNFAWNSYPNISQNSRKDAKLSASELRNSRPPGQSETGLRLYQFCERYALEPQIVNTTCAYCAWRFHLTDTSNALKIKAVQHHGLQKGPEVYAEGAAYYRLRCVRVPNDVSAITESNYFIQSTKWPAYCFVSVNQQPMCNILQKLPSGRNPAADLTAWVQDGENLIKVSVQPANRNTSETYSFAIEIIRVINHSKILSMVSKIGARDSLASITATLNDAGEDDDLVVVDQSVSIDLIDPYMATIWQIPTRGKHCLHRECFDLETFLQSRPSIVRGGPSNPDAWNCPICKKDARPQNLVVDGFLAEVREQLVEDGKLDSRALFVRGDGTWEAKTEKADGDMKKEIFDPLSNIEGTSETTTLVTHSPSNPISQASNLAPSDLEIIEIED